MPRYSFDHTILVLAFRSNRAGLSEILGGNQCKDAGLGEKSLGSLSSFSTVLLDIGNLALKGVTTPARSWREDWYEGQCDDLGECAMKSVQFL